jgi:hypothetical protein
MIVLIGVATGEDGGRPGTVGDDVFEGLLQPGVAEADDHVIDGFGQRGEAGVAG